MNMENVVIENEIEVSIGENTYLYDLKCSDGEAIGTLCPIDLNDPDAPRVIKMEYPKLADVLADEDMCDHILEYRGLHDLSPSDIHYGDVMMAFGEVVEKDTPELLQQYKRQYNLKTYEGDDLASILRKMASYVEDCRDTSYFLEIVKTKLFHDAIGKVEWTCGDEATVSIDH